MNRSWSITFMNPVTVLVVAPRAAARAACVSALAGDPRLQVIAEASSPGAALAAVRRRRPDVVVLAAPLTSRRVAALLDALGAASTRVIIVARQTSSALLLGALARGAIGHLEPAAVRRWLNHAVHAVARGEAWCAREVVPMIVSTLCEARTNALGRLPRRALY
jgi:DNA-binding NarL/FixJ family response regulator